MVKDGIGDFYNRNKLAERWDISVNSISNYVREGKIPFIRTPGGRKLLFPKKAIHEYEEKQLTWRSVRKKPYKRNKKTFSAPKNKNGGQNNEKNKKRNQTLVETQR